MTNTPPVIMAVVTPMRAWLRRVMTAKALPLIQVDIVIHAASTIATRVTMLGYRTYKTSSCKIRCEVSGQGPSCSGTTPRSGRADSKQ